jgi:very-short-patch-repair endonuclease
MSSTEDRLRRLLRSRALHPYRFNVRCEIGPFAVANVCPERSLIVELQAQADQRQQQRAAFLAGLGYTVLRICPLELQRQPRRALRRVQDALRAAGG